MIIKSKNIKGGFIKAMKSSLSTVGKGIGALRKTKRNEEGERWKRYANKVVERYNALAHKVQELERENILLRGGVATEAPPPLPNLSRIDPSPSSSSSLSCSVAEELLLRRVREVIQEKKVRMADMIDAKLALYKELLPPASSFRPPLGKKKGNKGGRAVFRYDALPLSPLW